MENEQFLLRWVTLTQPMGIMPITAQRRGTFFPRPVSGVSRSRMMAISGVPLPVCQAGTASRCRGRAGRLAAGFSVPQGPAERRYATAIVAVPLTRSAIWIRRVKGRSTTSNAMRFAVRSGVAVRSGQSRIGWNRSARRLDSNRRYEHADAETKPISTDQTETKSLAVGRLLPAAPRNRIRT